MAYARFSPEGRYTAFIHEERTTSAFVATLAKLRGLGGLSQTRLSAVERGQGLEHDAARNLNELMNKLERLRDALKPIPVRFWNAADINTLFELLDANRLAAFVVADAGEFGADHGATTIDR